MRLDNATLQNAKARLPAFDRTRLTPGIVHIGLGAFYRAHGIVYNDDAIETDPAAHNGWGIIGVSLRSPSQRDRLALQGGLYTAIERSASGDKPRIMGSLLQAVVAPEDPRGLVETLADPGIRIVTITVTEKGYCHDPATGRLNPAHSDIIHDLEHPEAPVSLPGFLVAALKLRKNRGIAPFTVISCDNLPSNGKLLRGLIRDFAALRDDGLAAWIESNVAFPSTMVDRIVPASTDNDLALARDLIGLNDLAPVIHEPFRQWVIEDIFGSADRPAWERAGAQFVTDVEPFELMKLRMLNGSHSALAYLGFLSSFETISQTVADPVFKDFLAGLWGDEIIPTVPAPAGTNLSAYAGQLLERYANPAISHRTAQIAMDGSQKLPQRILGTIRDRLHAGQPWNRLALTVAAFIYYAGGSDEKGRPIDVKDPLADRLKADGQDPAAHVRRVTFIETIFGTDLGRDERFLHTVEAAYRKLLTGGAHAAVSAINQTAE
ncbi:mannitol dehydrogenase family protein [Phyllobacterium leguminum]|uniref:Fructuronate reductase n=1 Tax=Phyllobacterium leguminum TaxID=314237 RepID=A0A318SXC4_9HYPH|nr:mannitol dehydrogenase family protein [Phyllobacterium leguminum]PYE86595.1 fructuronate reductase [Phyllobacterium leguminum]